MSKKKDYDFSEEAIQKKRRFPVWQTIFLVILVIIQIVLIFGIIFYRPTPQDNIDSYEIFVTPLDDGSLDIEYRFEWTALDEDEPLTWVEIGVPNTDFSIYETYSSTISSFERYANNDEGLSYVIVNLKGSYIGGETVKFSFKINQRGLLCSDSEGPFFELVPGWFNSIPVSEYSFNWKASDKIESSNADIKGSAWHTWKGSFEPGGYRIMRVNYEKFSAPLYHYYEFNDEGAYNQLSEDRVASIVIFSILILVCLIFELSIIDCYVSYVKGRGFLSGYGHPVHTYGRRNHLYVRAYHSHHSSSSGSRGGGCACACACACAGGGRAGCSQKDTTDTKNLKKQTHPQ